jgi:hypothetical protein
MLSQPDLNGVASHEDFLEAIIKFAAEKQHLTPDV